MRLFLSLALAAATALLAGCGQPAALPAIQPSEVKGGKPFEPPEPEGGTRFPNPLYLHWVNFPVGSTIITQTITENEDNPKKTVTKITAKLVAKGDDQLEIESRARTVHFSDDVTENPPEKIVHKRTFSLPKGSTPPEADKSKGTEEPFQVGDRTFKSKTAHFKGRAEHGEMLTQTWTSEEVPGHLLKSVSKIPAQRATITVEVIEVHIPK